MEDPHLPKILWLDRTHNEFTTKIQEQIFQALDERIELFQCYDISQVFEAYQDFQEEVVAIVTAMCVPFDGEILDYGGMDLIHTFHSKFNPCPIYVFSKGVSQNPEIQDEIQQFPNTFVMRDAGHLISDMRHLLCPGDAMQDIIQRFALEEAQLQPSYSMFWIDSNFDQNRNNAEILMRDILSVNEKVGCKGIVFERELYLRLTRLNPDIHQMRAQMPCFKFRAVALQDFNLALDAIRLHREMGWTPIFCVINCDLKNAPAFIEKIREENEVMGIFLRSRSIYTEKRDFLQHLQMNFPNIFGMDSRNALLQYLDDTWMENLPVLPKKVVLAVGIKKEDMDKMRMSGLFFHQARNLSQAKTALKTYVILAVITSMHYNKQEEHGGRDFIKHIRKSKDYANLPIFLLSRSVNKDATKREEYIQKFKVELGNMKEANVWLSQYAEEGMMSVWKSVLWIGDYTPEQKSKLIARIGAQNVRFCEELTEEIISSIEDLNPTRIIVRNPNIKNLIMSLETKIESEHSINVFHEHCAENNAFSSFDRLLDSLWNIYEKPTENLYIGNNPIANTIGCGTNMKNVKPYLAKFSLFSIFIELADTAVIEKMLDEIREHNIWVRVIIIDATIYNDLHGSMLSLLRRGASLVVQNQDTAVKYLDATIAKMNAMKTEDYKRAVDRRLDLFCRRNNLLKRKQQVTKTGGKPFEMRVLDKENKNDILDYNDAKDKFEKFAQKQGQFKVKEIKKVENIDLEIRYCVARAHLWNPEKIGLYFHGSKQNVLPIISETGFRFGSRNSGWFGGGVYFATDSSKSHGYSEKGTAGYQMLICEVAIGELHHATSAMQSALPETTKGDYDTIFGPRKVKTAGMANYDEWIIWHPDQALPKYLITYDQQVGNAFSKL